MNKKVKYIFNILFAIYIGLVLFVCLHKFEDSGNNLGGFFLGIRMDKVAHFIMFFPYPFVTWLNLVYSGRTFKSPYTPVLIVLISGLLIASATEFMQEYMTIYRDGDPFDFVADITGIITGSLIILAFGRYIKKGIDWILEKISPQ